MNNILILSVQGSILVVSVGFAQLIFGALSAHRLFASLVPRFSYSFLVTDIDESAIVPRGRRAVCCQCAADGRSLQYS